MSLKWDFMRILGILKSGDKRTSVSRIENLNMNFNNFDIKWNSSRIVSVLIQFILIISNFFLKNARKKSCFSACSMKSNSATATFTAIYTRIICISRNLYMPRHMMVLLFHTGRVHDVSKVEKCTYFRFP